MKNYKIKSKGDKTYEYHYRKEKTRNYFRITAHQVEKNVSFIADSNGKFEKLWQFSSYLVSRGCKIYAVSSSDGFLPCGIKPIPFNGKQFVIRTCYMGTPTWTTETVDGKFYKAIRVKDMLYVPDKEAK